MEVSTPYASHSNEAAERLIKDHCTCARVIFFTAQLPLSLWAEAIVHANWHRNRLPAARIGGNIPLYLWNPAKRIEFSKILACDTSSIAFVYRRDTAKEKRTFYGQFIGMISDTSLIKVSILHTKATISVQRKDFRLYKGI